MKTPYQVKSWNYEPIEGLVSSSVVMHLLPQDKLISLVERCLYGDRYLLIVSTDVIDMDAKRFYYYRSEKSSSGLFVSKSEIKEITKETNKHIHQAVSHVMRIDLARSSYQAVSTVKKRGDLGGFDALVDIAKRVPIKPINNLAPVFCWKGFISVPTINVKTGFLEDGVLENETSDNSAIPIEVTVTSQENPKSTLWVEKINKKPVMVKIIFAFISDEKVDLLFRKHGKKIKIIRENVDKGHESQTHFFSTGLVEKLLLSNNKPDSLGG